MPACSPPLASSAHFSELDPTDARSWPSRSRTRSASPACSRPWLAAARRCSSTRASRCGPLLDAISAHGATVLHGLAGALRRPARARSSERPTLRTGFVAGAACPPGILEALDAAGLDDPERVRHDRDRRGHGLPRLRPGLAAQHDRGRPLPGYEFRVAPGEHPDGRGRASGARPVRDHRLLPAAGADGGGVRRRLVPHRRPRTIDAAGYVSIAGRAKEVVHVAGFNVFPAEVEGFLSPTRTWRRPWWSAFRTSGWARCSRRTWSAPGRDIEPGDPAALRASQIAG